MISYKRIYGDTETRLICRQRIQIYRNIEKQCVAQYLTRKPFTCFNPLDDAHIVYSGIHGVYDTPWIIRSWFLRALFCCYYINHGKFEWKFRYLIFQIISVTDVWGISCELAFRWMSLDLTDDKSTLVQVMAWCRQATSHCMSQCWPRSLSPYGVAMPQWVKYWVGMDSCDTFSSTYQDCSVTHSFTYRRVLVWLLVSYCGINTECQSLTIIQKTGVMPVVQH